MGALAGALVSASFAWTADNAMAAYTATVNGGVLSIVGDGASDKLALRLRSGSPTTLDVDVDADGTAEHGFDRSTFSAIDVNAGGGDDDVSIDQSGGSFADETLTINGGSGADSLLGGAGADTLLGGTGNDLVTGGRGDDRALLGDGEDRFAWSPGDGNDVVEGQAQRDRLEVAGSGASETIDVSAAGSRVRFTRDVAAVALDLAGVERVSFAAAGGADTVFVNSLSGTGVEVVETDLRHLGAGDGAVDNVVARGTSGHDRIMIGSTADTLLVAGLAAQLQITGSEAALDNVDVATLDGGDTITTGTTVAGPASINVDGGAGSDILEYSATAAADTVAVAAGAGGVDVSAPAAAPVDTTAVERLMLRGLGGADTIAASGSPPAGTNLTIDGGEGDDNLSGSNGTDYLVAGNGHDSVDGNMGADLALLGGGDDYFRWDPGDGNDTVQGEAGDDVLEFLGNSASESISVSASGSSGRIVRNVASVITALGGVERLMLRTAGGADAISVNDLAATTIRTVDVDLGAVSGGGDGARDTVTVLGTQNPDIVELTRGRTQVLATGLAAQTRITGSEAADDTLLLHTLGGDDAVTLDPAVNGLITPIIDLGSDD